jgi:hypothetical protein
MKCCFDPNRSSKKENNVALVISPNLARKEKNNVDLQGLLLNHTFSFEIELLSENSL